jgi:TPR repeat protein
MASICQAGDLLSYDDANARGWGVAAPDYTRATAWLRQCGAARDESKLPPVAGGEALYVADPDPVMAMANDDAARALLRLGDLSRDGIGQPQDLAAARTYYQQAATKGLEEAKRQLDEISPR